MANEMAGKTVVITGASQGIGKAAAIDLAKLGAELVLVVRDARKADAAVAEIREATPAAKIDLVFADLSLMSAVRKAAAEIKARHPKIHVLLNNAGVVMTERKVTAEGHELTFATNHLNYFVLTHELLDVLKASAPARIINVASDAHVGQRIDFDDLMGEKSFKTWKAYGQSKLANVMFTYELARRLEGTGVTANALHPGVVATNFGKNNQNWFGWGVKLLAPFFTSPSKGAATSVFLASSATAEGVSGKYFKRSKARKSSGWSYKVDAQKRLWEVSEKLAGLAG